MNKEEFINLFAKYQISISSLTYEELLSFMRKTLEVNEKFNLTAIKDENSFIEKMLLDSGLVISSIDLSNKKVIDVGTGAGFPGLVLYILNKDIKMTLLDSISKKINHLKNYCEGKGYKVETICDRAENYASKHKEVFDYALARAVAPLRVLLEIIIPLVKVNGHFIALKGPGYEEEIMESSKAFKKLDCEVNKVNSYTLPNGEQRFIIFIKKNKTTNKKYPREYKLIKELPL